jgi:uncharacterized protein with von Willebrand factor type A (vWA) domain
VQAQELRNKELAEKTFAGMKKELSNAKKTTSRVTDYYKNVNRISSYDAHFLDEKK